MNIPLNPHDAEVIRVFAELHSLTPEEAERCFLEMAVQDSLVDEVFQRKLRDHAAVIRISRESKDPYPEPRSRW